jgi:hypothetical protein
MQSSHSDYLSVVCAADVTLDPFPFGGGVTLSDSLSCGDGEDGEMEEVFHGHENMHENRHERRHERRHKNTHVSRHGSEIDTVADDKENATISCQLHGYNHHHDNYNYGVPFVTAPKLQSVHQLGAGIAKALGFIAVDESTGTISTQFTQQQPSETMPAAVREDDGYGSRIMKNDDSGVIRDDKSNMVRIRMDGRLTASTDIKVVNEVVNEVEVKKEVVVGIGELIDAYVAEAVRVAKLSQQAELFTGRRGSGRGSERGSGRGSGG